MKKVTILNTVVEPQPLKHSKGRFVGRVLQASESYDLEDDQAEKLIDAKRAVPAGKGTKAEDEGTPREQREKELKKLSAAEVDTLVAEKSLTPGGNKKEDKIAAILAAEFPAA